MQWKRGLLLLLVLALVAAGGWLALPHAMALLPGGVQARLPHQLLELVRTPIPTALPARPTAVATIELSAISRQLSALSAPSPPTATPPPTLPATVAPTAPPTAPPTPIPQPTNQSPSQPANPPTSQPTSPPTPTATPHSEFPDRLRSPVPNSAFLDGLRIAPQKLNNCGPTNLSIVLSYLGQETAQLQVAGVVKPNEDDRNVSPADLVAYVNEETPLRARAFVGGDLETLKRLIAAGYPVIIEKGMIPSQWEGWMGHYQTLFGYDDTLEEFLALDTFLGPWDSSGRSETYAATAEFWQHFNDTFIVVYPAGEETAVFERLPDAFRNPVTMWQRAAQRAEQTLRTDHDNAFAWFNLGSSLTHLAELTGDETLFRTAVAAFDQARQIGLPWRMLWYQFAPYRAYLAAGEAGEVIALTDVVLQGGGFYVEETHLYRGQALAELGQEWAAGAAFRQAAEINPYSLLLAQMQATPVGEPVE